MNSENNIAPATYPDLLAGCSKVLVVRLRSIGDTVLATPTLKALKRHLPNAKIDILLEDWVAPLIEGHSAVNAVLSAGNTARERLASAASLRKKKYDAVINLHGGTTSTFLTRATGARIRAGYAHYQYSFLHTHLFGSASDFWGRDVTHSAEQQLALAGYLGVPVGDKPGSELEVAETALESVKQKLSARGIPLDAAPIALIHPAAATFTKMWDLRKFAAVADHLDRRGFSVAAVASAAEAHLLEELADLADVRLGTFPGLTLPEVSALASISGIFVGNDSGVAHIAAAVGTPPVVVFGSSNRDHWRPWSGGPSAIVFREFPCQPCPGYECAEFGNPRCIQEIGFEEVRQVVDDLLATI